MASLKQTWAKDAESGGADSPSHSSTPGDSRPYADTNRFGKTQTGGFTRPIQKPQNLVSDPVWGVQAPVGGTPAEPEVRATTGE